MTRRRRMLRRDSTNITPHKSMVDWFPSEPTGLSWQQKAKDTNENLCAMGAVEFPDSLWIPEQEWKERARFNDENGLWAEDRKNRFTNQGGGTRQDGRSVRGTHECTCHSFVQGCEAAYNRTRLGQGLPVYFSAMSVYAEANPGQWGGAGCLQVLGIGMERGILPDHAGPGGIDAQSKYFKHTLTGTAGKGNKQQSSGPWVSLKDFPSGWQETAYHFRPREIVNPRKWQEIVCLLLHGFVVNVGRYRHAIPYNGVGWSSDDLLIPYTDSYDVIRYDSKNTLRSAVGGASCITEMTIPDNWLKPVPNELLISA